ncbi:MAG: hypothetical protein ABFD97_20195 [Syntrophobacter sp.]
MAQTLRVCGPRGCLKKDHCASLLFSFIVMFMVVSWLLTGVPAYSQVVVTEKDKEFKPKVLAVPYAFYNHSFGAAAGFVYSFNGYHQKQMSVLGTAIAGTNDALALYLVTRDFQAPFLDRLFIDSDFALSTFGELQSYTDGRPGYANERAGSNDSSYNNYIEGPGNDNFARVKFRYLLPIGSGRDEIISSLVLDQGLLAQGRVGADSWNPFTSGKTFLEVKPYWRSQSVRSDDRRVDRQTNGLEMSVFRENTDFPRNPTQGSTQRFRYTRDWGLFDSTNPYDVLDVEYSKYFSLGPTKRFKQRVIAFDFWTANVFSWDDYSTRNSGQAVYHRPPPYAGAMLGGLWRMRAYPTSRFSDQAAVYYALEYRMIPEWNPFADIEWVRKHLDIAWWQWVPFVEAGRVAPRYTVDELHTKMQWDVGLGIRAMAKGMTVRIDTAVSNENWGVQMMIGHPFQF